MKTIIFYYTGTGNSLWSARLLAEGLGGAKLLPMKEADALAAGDAEAVGFVFPVHMWGVPGPVVQFIEKLSLRPAGLLVCPGGQRRPGFTHPDPAAGSAGRARPEAGRRFQHRPAQQLHPLGRAGPGRAPERPLC